MKDSKPCPVPWDYERPFRDVMRNGEHDTEDCNFLAFDLGNEHIGSDDGADYIEVHGPNQEANAALIRKAVNRDHLFDELIRALEYCVRVSDNEGLKEEYSKLLDKARGL